MTRQFQGLRQVRGVSGIVACSLLLLFIVPLVHDEMACARAATHCLTCAASGMAAAPAGRVSSVNGSHLAASSFVPVQGSLLRDTILAACSIGRSPPDISLEPR